MDPAAAAARLRASLSQLADRAEAGSLTPLSGLHAYDPDASRGFRQAAVLLLFTPSADPRAGLPDIILIQRSRDLRNSPGDIAFPGGSLDEGEDAVTAALRETHEEIGLHPDHVEVIGRLAPLAMPHIRFVVTPVLGWTDRAAAAGQIQPGEVLRTIRVGVETLVTPENRRTVMIEGRSTHGFLLPDGFVWGMTANLLDHVLTALGWARDWDHGQTLPIRRAPDGVWEPEPGSLPR